MDEPQEPEALNAPAVEDNSAATPPVDEPTTSESPETEGQADDTQVNESAAEATDSEAERKPSRAERRIHQLTDKFEQLQQSNQPAQNFGPTPQAIDVQQFVGEDGYLDPTAANQNINNSVVQLAQGIAGQAVSQALAQERAVNNFNLDVSELQNNALVQDVPEIEQAISEEFESRAFKEVGKDPYTGQPIMTLDPSVRLADIAKRHLKVAEAAAKRSSAEMKNAVARTADEGALRPGQGTSRGEKSAEDMSIAEMEAKYGIVRN